MLPTRLGKKDTQTATISREDRIGYVSIRDKKDAPTGAKEWRLLDINKPVQGFDLKYVYTKKIWFGFKSVQHAHICAVMGEKGEEFRPIPYSASIGEYKPVFDGDRGLLYHKLAVSIEEHNKFVSWWKQNLMTLALGAIGLLCCIMLFLSFLTLKDIADKLGAVAGNFGTCSQQTAQLLAQQQNKTSTTPKAGSVAGIPFGITGG